MSDPQLKRKLKKREENRVRILQKKNEGIHINILILWGRKVSLVLCFFLILDEEGNAVDQQLPEEIERKFSIFTCLLSFYFIKPWFPGPSKKLKAGKKEKSSKIAAKDAEEPEAAEEESDHDDEDIEQCNIFSHLTIHFPCYY